MQSQNSGCAPEGRALPGLKPKLSEKSQPGSARAHLCRTLGQGTGAPQLTLCTSQQIEVGENEDNGSPSVPTFRLSASNMCKVKLEVISLLP